MNLKSLPRNKVARRHVARVGHTAAHATYFGFVAFEHSGIFGATAVILLLFCLSEIYGEVLIFKKGEDLPNGEED